MTIEPGAAVTVVTATGEHLVMRAVSGRLMGRDMQVVWVCTEEEFQRHERDGGEVDKLPWPAEAVSAVAPPS